MANFMEIAVKQQRKKRKTYKQGNLENCEVKLRNVYVEKLEHARRVLEKELGFMPSREQALKYTLIAYTKDK